MTMTAVLLLSLVGLLVRGTLAFPVGSGTEYFSNNPDVQELMAEVNMDHPIAIKNIEFATTYLRQGIEEVIPGRVYQALAYTMGYPTVVILDDDTLMLIDPAEDYFRMKDIIDLFREVPAIGNKPFSAVASTLFHGDHIWSLCAILEDPHNVGTVDVYMNERTPIEEINFNTFNALKFPRIMRQFGIWLPGRVFLHHANVLRAYFRPAACPGIPKNVQLLHFTDSDEVTRTIGNTEVRFVAVPGYTTDQTLIYFPSMELIHAADLYDQSFPNIYAIRGEPPRDAKAMSDSVYKVARYPGVTTVIGTHARPLYGPDKAVLLNIADGVRYVHDQTIRFMMKGLEPGAISKHITLPAAQEARPYNIQVYGVIETGSRAVYSNIVGWFDGNAENLVPVTEPQRRQRLNDLLGVDRTLVEAAKAYDDGDYAWSLELASNVFREDPSNRRAKEIRSLAMIRLAEDQVSIATRYYFLSSVLEDWGLLPQDLDIDTLGSVRTLAMSGVFIYMQTHVNAEKLDADGGVEKTFFVEMDSGTFQFDLRNGVLEIREVSSLTAGGLALLTTDADFREFLISGTLVGNILNGTESDWRSILGYIDFTDQV